MYDISELEKIPIMEVAKKLGIVVKNKKAICFMHKEKTASLSFDTKKNIWKCFGCNTGGAVINLVMKRNNFDFKRACDWLEKEFFHGQPSFNRTKENYQLKRTYKKKTLVKEAIHEPDHEIYSYVINSLMLSEKDVDYLTIERALDLEVIKKNNIRTIDNIKSFYKNIRGQFNENRLIAAGLLKVADDGQVKDTWWRSGILFPYYNYHGEIETLQLRPHQPFPPNAKYILLSNISPCLYNEESLKSMENNSVLYICEGAPDTLSMLSYGLNAVGLPGAGTMKDSWIELIGRFSIIIVFDNDTAGQKGADDLSERLKDKGISVKKKKISSQYHDVNQMLIAERKKQYDK